MDVPGRKTAATTPVAFARRCRHLDAELTFCRSALSRGNALAAYGELDSACRDAWLGEDAANAIERVIAKVEDAERLNRYQAELACVQGGLDELKICLGIPSGRH